MIVYKLALQTYENMGCSSPQATTLNTVCQGRLYRPRLFFSSLRVMVYVEDDCKDHSCILLSLLRYEQMACSMDSEQIHRNFVSAQNTERLSPPIHTFAVGFQCHIMNP